MMIFLFIQFDFHDFDLMSQESKSLNELIEIFQIPVEPTCFDYFLQIEENQDSLLTLSTNKGTKDLCDFKKIFLTNKESGNVEPFFEFDLSNTLLVFIPNSKTFINLKSLSLLSILEQIRLPHSITSLTKDLFQKFCKPSIY